VRNTIRTSWVGCEKNMGKGKDDCADEKKKGGKRKRPFECFSKETKKQGDTPRRANYCKWKITQ